MPLLGVISIGSPNELPLLVETAKHITAVLSLISFTQLNTIFPLRSMVRNGHEVAVFGSAAIILATCGPSLLFLEQENRNSNRMAKRYLFIRASFFGESIPDADVKST